AGFDRAGFLGKSPPERLDANADRAFLDRVRTGYIDLDVLGRELDELGPAPDIEARRTALVATRSRTDELQASLVFPLFGSAETEQGPWLLGLFCVRDDRTDDAFDADDIDTFRQLAIGAARVIESSQAYERVKERDRLAALGEMAAGLAHEIRNPLGALKAAAQLLLTADWAGATHGGRGDHTFRGRQPDRDRRISIDHRRGGEPVEQRRDPVPRLRSRRAAGPRGGRQGRPQRGRAPAPAAAHPGAAQERR